ncbi:hypothetical protein RvY_18989-2 [Ramazzottius varieornatus]|uniref:Uncharacterized protein n=1 Tax=Ramazzottius varieornatus TaxID=947166 RepID=A0A1D1W942_RAMVA|nr:hypothetical protein RvY_18989-2 [Ramazzottius varieornatus]
MVFPLHNFQPGRSTGFWMTFEFLPTCQNAVAGGESHQITGRLRDLPALPHPSLSSSPVSPLYPSASVYRRTVTSSYAMGVSSLFCPYSNQRSDRCSTFSLLLN